VLADFDRVELADVYNNTLIYNHYTVIWRTTDVMEIVVSVIAPRSTR